MSDDTPPNWETPVPEWLDKLPNVLPQPDPALAELLRGAGLYLKCISQDDAGVTAWVVNDLAEGQPVATGPTQEAAAWEALARLRDRAEEWAEQAGCQLWDRPPVPPIIPPKVRRRLKGRD